MNTIFNGARRYLPGLIIAALVAIAAQFLSDHYGAPAMLMAILIGLALNFLATEERTVAGVGLAARGVLRLGVAMLGMRISVETLGAFGVAPLVLVAAAVALTIAFGVLVSRVIGLERLFGFLTGGAVGICGASAALAIGAVLPPTPERERDISFTVISVTLASTLAMILYPILAAKLSLSGTETALLLGATIHDVAQVVGAGFSVSEDIGEAATLIKLFRVVLLAPVVMLAAVMWRRPDKVATTRKQILPGFVVAFLALAGANSVGQIPEAVKAIGEPVTRAALLMAVGAVGIRTSIPALATVGPRALMLVVAETLFLLAFVAASVVLISV